MQKPALIRISDETDLVREPPPRSGSKYSHATFLQPVPSSLSLLRPTFLAKNRNQLVKFSHGPLLSMSQGLALLFLRAHDLTPFKSASKNLL